LIGDGLQHWADHQRTFWMVAGSCALVFGGLRLAELYGWVKFGNQTALVVLAYTYVLFYWLKITLYDDWKQRSVVVARDKARVREAFPSLAFFGFCIAYSAAVFALSFFLFTRLDDGALGGAGADLLPTAMFLAESVVLLVVAALFANFLLFLPARAAGVRSGLGEAFRLAAGTRLRLVGLALLCTGLSLIGVVSLVALAMVRLPEAGWVFAAGRALAVVIDLLALYVAAYGLGRIFAAQSGWKPEPLPAA
jgi:hypothetical protein